MSVLSERGRKALETSRSLRDPVVVRSNPWSPQNPSGNVNLETAVNPLCADLWREKFEKDLTWDFDPEIMQYSNFAGTEDVRKGVAAFVSKFFNAETEIDPSHLLLFPGTSAAMDAIASVICNENEGIMSSAPYYDKFASICAARAGVHIISSDMELISSKNGNGEYFEMNVKQFQKAYSQAIEQNVTPRGLILCNPNNPLGMAYSPEDLIPILEFAEEKNLIVIMDEIYGLSIHDKESSKFRSLLSWISHAPNRDRIIWIAGLSKDFGLPSFKISILHVENSELRECLNSFQAYQPVPLPIQQVGHKIFSDFEWISEVFIPTNMKRLTSNKELAMTRMRQIGATVHPSDSATFIFCDFKKFMREVRKEEELKLYWKFVEAGVFMKSGKILRCPVPGWFRVVITVPQDALSEGLNRIEKVLIAFAKPN